MERYLIGNFKVTEDNKMALLPVAMRTVSLKSTKYFQHQGVLGGGFQELGSEATCYETGEIITREDYGSLVEGEDYIIHRFPVISCSRFEMPHKGYSLPSVEILFNDDRI